MKELILNAPWYVKTSMALILSGLIFLIIVAPYVILALLISIIIIASLITTAVYFIENSKNVNKK